jgi:hypothetical protein
MSRGLEARLKKLESRTMSLQARLARMSDEQLHAAADELVPNLLAGLAAGAEAEQALARTLLGRRWAEFMPQEKQQIHDFLLARQVAQV